MDPTPSTLKLAWLLLKKMAGIPTATADTEGQLRYTRDGDVTGAFKMFRYILGGTYDAQEIVGTTATQTLTNKTFTAPTMADFTNANHDHLDADDGGTLTLAAIPAVTASAAELNIMDGVTTSTAELNFVDGVTSAIQTQLDGKVNDTGDTITGDLTITRNSTTAFVVEDASNVDNFKIDTTGNWVQVANGSNLAGYSDNYSTETFKIEASTGNAQFDGTGQFDGNVTLGGALDHNGTTAGFYGVTPATRPTAYTQTYSTADKTHANPTATAVTNAFGTANGTYEDTSGTSSAIANNFQESATQINALIADVADVKQLINSIIDDLQTLGLLQ